MYHFRLAIGRYRVLNIRLQLKWKQSLFRSTGTLVHSLSIVCVCVNVFELLRAAWRINFENQSFNLSNR